MDNNNLRQPTNQPMGQSAQPMSGQYPYPNQPMPMRPPKQPMNPEKKRKLILGFSLGGAAVVFGIAAAIMIPILMRVDYSSAYKTAGELKPKIYDIYQSYDCEYVTDYVNSSYTSIKSYGEYIENCKATFASDVNELVAKLESTDGVKRNSEIGAQFTKFKDEFAKITSGDTSDLEAKLGLYAARHNFVVAADELYYSSSSDAEFAAAAKYLTDSGNDALKTYGEGWLEKSLAIAAAYRAYDAASWRESSQYYNEYTNKKNELSDWIAANKPDIATIAPLNFDDTSKMYSEFSTLYDLIAKTYAQNYNSGSGDCYEILGEVYCD